jgi:glutathione S-transferase
MSSEELTLWGAGTVRQLRPHWMLAEMGLDYEFIPVLPRSGETYDPEFLKINPRHKIPVLRHRKFILCESAAILQYLSEAFEAPPGFYVPTNPVDRARVNEWCFFIMSELDAHALYVIRRHTDLKDLYGEATTAVEAARAYFRDQFEPVAPRLAQSGQFLFGDRVSIADILLGTTLDWAIAYSIPIPDVARAYRERLVSRPAYRRAVVRAFPARSSMNGGE